MSHGVAFLLAGKSHLRKAIAHHEESVREVSLCKKLRNIELLQEVLSAAHQRSQLKYAQHQEDDDLLNLMDAPDIICELIWVPVPGTECALCERQWHLGRTALINSLCRGWANPRNALGTGTGKMLLLLISLCPNPEVSL